MAREIERIISFVTAAEEKYPACIVAVSEKGADGEIEGWAAYAGGYPATMNGRDGAVLVGRFGEKLMTSRACAIFPFLPADLYRE